MNLFLYWWKLFTVQWKNAHKSSMFVGKIKINYVHRSGILQEVQKTHSKVVLSNPSLVILHFKRGWVAYPGTVRNIPHVFVMNARAFHRQSSINLYCEQFYVSSYSRKVFTSFYEVLWGFWHFLVSHTLPISVWVSNSL